VTSQSLAPSPLIAALLLGWGLWSAGPAAAVELYRNGEAVLRWNNTVKYSGGIRLDRPDPVLIADPNSDDGDRNFQPGFITNRFDLLSEMDFAATSDGLTWGANVSAAAWYDFVYNARTDAAETNPPGLYTPNAHFSAPVRDLHGRHIEMLNGYLYANTSVAEVPLNLRLGRHTLLWGESLFFAGNGIAAGQAPIDVIKALSVPLVRAKEVYMPVSQASLSLQLSPAVTVSGYYQFEWRKSRLPGAGSYFSAADFIDTGGYRLYVGPRQYLSRASDLKPKDAQFGLSLRYATESADYGFYALRYNAREPQIYLRPTTLAAAAESPESPDTRRVRPAAYGTAPGIFYGPSNPLNVLYPGGFGSATGSVGAYNLVYPEGIQIYGASFSGYLGDNSLAGEISLRRGAPLISTALVISPGTYGYAAPLYARGDTLHAQVSMVGALSPTKIWDDAYISAEIAGNRRMRVTHNAAALDPGRDRFAASAVVMFEPRFFAVLPGLDLSTPASMAYGLSGHSSIDGSQVKGAGSMSLALSATYRAAWNASLGITHFIGDPSRQPFTDRDFISFSLQRTF
jgi:hypothetical protein